ncbi:MAG TPA: Glu/Leu/Phe/Val dehydrogenase dimerization domain-containing protein [Pilimelia sp.]|nr:Glu/Leu/Phe/Val dehydrogenase dimerization domain-containing protein [Pilimelia sp.]
MPTPVPPDLDGAEPYEDIRIRIGPRSGLPVIVAVHSTVRGRAIGGCRIAHYPRWQDGLTDALRLSAAMTAKCAVAGLPHGGGKVVVAVAEDTALTGARRRAVLHDVGDAIAALDGAYATGPDVGTGPDDMTTIAERTPYVFCRPPERGGSGDSSGHTAAGVLAALRAVCAERFAAPLAAHRFAVVGLGRVGGQLARLLAAAGAELVVSDIDPAGRRLAGELGAAWVDPADALRAPVDVLVPAALGGVLTPVTVPLLRCAAVAGPANNQLDAPATADLLHRRGILWAPDFVVSAGGVIHATAVELGGRTGEEAARLVTGIEDTLAGVLTAARTAGTSPMAAALALARRRTAPRPAEVSHS